jgi:hypothetical protein
MSKILSSGRMGRRLCSSGGPRSIRPGEGSTSYLARETVKWLNVWRMASGVQGGGIFRRPLGQGAIGSRLHADVIADVYKRVARWIGMSEKQVNQISGHSIRVGATQGLVAHKIDLSSTMQAGRWKSTRMPLRYGKEWGAGRGAMARVEAMRTTNSIFDRYRFRV